MSHPEENLPNFFLVGAPKAGTTSLYHYLDQHPGIYMSPLKEVSYFALEIRPEYLATQGQPRTKQSQQSLRQYLDAGAIEKRFSGIVTEWDDYCRLFAHARGQKAIGEASVHYLWSKTAAARIAARIPHAKILIVLRNPVERAFSQYLHHLSLGVRHASFREYLRAAFAHPIDKQLSPLHPFLELGLYAEQLKRYHRHFPAQQIGLWLYEDTRSPSFHREVFEFLQVDPDFQVDTTLRYLEPRVPEPGLRSTLRNSALWRGLRHALPMPIRSSLRKFAYKKPGAVQMQPAERALLIDYYREDIHKLERLLQRDLSAWLK